MHTRQTPETMMKSALRLERGIALLSNPSYTFEPFAAVPGLFYVEKASGENYLTNVPKATCTCPDFLKEQTVCKHYFACEELLQQEAQCANAPEEEYVDPYIGSNIGGYDY